jgi:enterochelin esterase family protein
LFLAVLAALPVAAAAQQPALNSHEVNPDHSVTFRYYGPSAQKVAIGLDYDHHQIPLAKGADGVWVLTTAPLQPALHMYSLEVDGTPILDPLNRMVDPNLVYLTNEVAVPGTPQLWDVADVPHGVVHHHSYRSAAIVGLPDGTEDYYVYTPPGYDAAGPKTYPALYLLHGWSATAESWIHDGKANLILDNLIAQGRAVPMIAVMPLGYGDLGFVTGGSRQWEDESMIGRNLGLFSTALLSEIVPQVEAGYRASARREDRAIAGLSMGGGESLVIGLNHPDRFAWIGGFSSAVEYKQFDGVFPGLDPKVAPRLLWVACGTEDELIEADRRFVSWLRARALQPTAVETPGIHNWPVWRDNLIRFAPLLFRPRRAPVVAWTGIPVKHAVADALAPMPMGDLLVLWVDFESCCS